MTDPPQKALEQRRTSLSERYSLETGVLDPIIQEFYFFFGIYGQSIMSDSARWRTHIHGSTVRQWGRSMRMIAEVYRQMTLSVNQTFLIGAKDRCSETQLKIKYNIILEPLARRRHHHLEITRIDNINQMTMGRSPAATQIFLDNSCWPRVDPTHFDRIPLWYPLSLEAFDFCFSFRQNDTALELLLRPVKTNAPGCFGCKYFSGSHFLRCTPNPGNGIIHRNECSSWEPLHPVEADIIEPPRL